MTRPLVVTALVTALLLFPGQYFVPKVSVEKPYREVVAPSPPAHWALLEKVPGVELFQTAVLILIAIVVHLCGWIQRKLTERRVIQLNSYLNERLDQLRGLDAQQEQLEGTVQMVQNATLEYNMLLYMLLHRRSNAYEAYDNTYKDYLKTPPKEVSTVE